MSLLILLLFFIFVTITTIKIFPVSLINREKSQEEGIIYQIKPFLGLLAPLNSRITSDQYRAKFKRKLIEAGEPVNLSADEFIALKEYLLILGAIIFFVVFQSNFFAILGGTLGFFLPNIWLNDEIKKRQKEIVRSMPYFLDLMTLIVEAGLDFGAAVDRIIQIGGKNALIDEFAIALQEMRLGTTRHTALKNLAARVNIMDVSSFIASLIQADQLGASLGRAMRIQADQMRTKRMQRAEKLGSEATVKMLIPLLVFIFPAVLIMLFGPIIIKAIQGGLF